MEVVSFGETLSYISRPRLIYSTWHSSSYISLYNSSSYRKVIQFYAIKLKGSYRKVLCIPYAKVKGSYALVSIKKQRNTKSLC